MPSIYLALGLALVALATLAGAQQPLKSPCPSAIKINTNYQFRNELHFICLQASSPASFYPRLEVIQYRDRHVLSSLQVDDVGADQLASFVDDSGVLRILLAVPGHENGTSMYSIDRDGKFVKETHSVNTQSVMSMAVWRLGLNWEWQLAIANQYSTRMYLGPLAPRLPLPDPKPIITFFSWRSSYFDSYELLTLPQNGHVNKLEPLNVNGQEMLLVAMGPLKNAPLGQATDSHLYRLDFSTGDLRWTHYQSLGTQLALDAKPFVITHQGSLLRHYFVAVLGQPARELANNRPAGAPAAGFGLIIYKYFGDKFISTNALAAPGATRLDAISYGAGDSYVIIALLSEWSNQVNLYLFDGMTLKPVASPMAPVAPVGPPNGRPRRTMVPANLHLFFEPSNELEPSEDGAAVKRTLLVEPQSVSSLRLPNIVISRFNTSDDGEPSAESATLYSIPVDEMIKSDQLVPPANDSYSKRTLAEPTDLVSWCQSTLKELLADGFHQNSKQLLALPRVDQSKPIELNGDLSIDGDLSVANLLFVNRVEQSLGNSSFRVVEEPFSDFSETFQEIQRLHLEIDSIKQHVDQILVDDGSTQDVFNQIAFDELFLECNSPMALNPLARHIPQLSCPHVDEIATTLLNSRNVSRIQQEAMLTGRTMTIDRDVRFEHLILKGNTEILGTLNGLPISEIVFKKGPSLYPIKGPKNFKNGLYSASELVVDSWDGASVGRNNYLTSTGEQRIDANLRFSQVIIDPSASLPARNSSSRFEKLNGLHLDSHLDNIATTDGTNNFEVPLRLDELILNGNVRFTTNARLSGVDLEDLWLHTMFKQSNQNVSAPMEFAGDVHVTYGGEIAVLGSVNKFDFSPNRILMRNRNMTFVNPFYFEQDVTTRELHVHKALNGIQVAPSADTGRPELAILYDGGTQWLTGDKVLNDVYLGGFSTIRGNINGHLDLGQLYSLATNNGDNHKFSTIRLSGQNIRLDDRAHLHIGGTINGFSTHDICTLASRIAQEPVTNYHRLRFEHSAHFKSIRCATVNGFNNLSNFFLTRYGDQHVAGTLRLTDGLIFNTTLNIQSTLNRLNVGPLASAIAQTINETRTGHKIIRGDLAIDDLIVDRINDLQLSNVLLTRSDSPQIVRAPLTFDHLDIENVLSVGSNLITNSFNGLNISDIVTNTLQYDAPQVIYNHVQLQTLQILPGSDLITPSFNGHDLRRLYSDAVLVDVPQQILAPKTFRTPVDFTNQVIFRHSIDDLTNEELRSILLLQSDELIHGDLELNHDVTVRKDLEIQSGIINDIDINTFVNSMLYENNTKSKGLRIFGTNGTVQFKDVKVNNLVVAGTVQGADLSKEAITRQDNLNGTYNARLAEQQRIYNNARLISSGSSLRVASNYRNQSLTGACQVHSCWNSAVKASNIKTVWRPVFQQPQQPPPPQSLALVQAPPQQVYFQPPVQVQVTPQFSTQTPQPQPQTYPQPPPQPQPQQLVLPQPQPLLPPQQPPQQQQVIQTLPVPVQPVRQHANTSLIYPQYPELVYLEYQRAQAVQELSYRVNKYLMASLFYEVSQREPHLGPVLGAVSNPAKDQERLLLFKGYACAPKDQTIAIMSPSLSGFRQISSIKDSSAPITVKSLVVGPNHYLVILDLSSVMLYLWNPSTAMYEPKESIKLEGGFPTALKVFSVGNLGCIALANPRVKQGKPVFFCQQSFQGGFNQKITIPMLDVFDLDIISSDHSSQIVFAALSRPSSLQIGELSIKAYDMATSLITDIASRRLARPLKLHFLRNLVSPLAWQLVVSEAITSNDDTQAVTRIFTLRLAPTRLLIQSNSTQFYESQLLRDNQFYDIQSVPMDGAHSMLFLQSAHSISIYAPQLSLDVTGECDTQYSLVQRLPTKGANKFLVFNERPGNASYGHNELLSHHLVLSRDDCEQQYSNLILRAKFK